MTGNNSVMSQRIHDRRDEVGNLDMEQREKRNIVTSCSVGRSSNDSGSERGRLEGALSVRNVKHKNIF